MKYLSTFIIILLTNTCMGINYEYRNIPIFKENRSVVDVFLISNEFDLEVNGVLYELGYKNLDGDSLIYYGEVGDRVLIRYWSGSEVFLYDGDERVIINPLNSSSVKTFGYKNNYWYGINTAIRGELANFRIVEGDELTIYNGILVGPIFAYYTSKSGIGTIDYKNIRTEYLLNEIQGFSYITTTDEVDTIMFEDSLHFLLELGLRETQVIDMNIFLDNRYKEIYKFYNKGNEVPLTILMRGLLNIISPYTTTYLYLNVDYEKYWNKDSNNLYRVLTMGSWGSAGYYVNSSLFNLDSSFIETVLLTEDIVSRIIPINTRIQDYVYYMSFLDTETGDVYIWADKKDINEKVPEEYKIEIISEGRNISESVSNLPFLRIN